MLLFLPQIIVGATLAILLAGNLSQRGFRSSWLLAVTGAGLSFASLLFLRLRLPLSLNASAWWAGEGLFSSINFTLDDVSWVLALISSGLLLAFLLLDAYRGVTAHWSYWAGSLALALAGLLSVISGDWLTLAFIWMLLDATIALAASTLVANVAGRRAALGFIPANLTAIFLLLAAWVLTGSSGQGSTVLVLLAAALRLGVFFPSDENPEAHMESTPSAILRLIPMASVIGLLARLADVQGPALGVTLLILFVPLLAHSLEFQKAVPDGSRVHFERGLACLALVAAAIGQPFMALTFGIGSLVASHWDLAAQAAGRLRWLVVAGSGLLLAALPFIRVISSGQPSNLFLIAVAFVLIDGILIAGWLRSPVMPRSEPTGSEPWMRTIRVLGLLLMPMLFVLLATPLAPQASVVTEVSWQGLAAILLATSLIVLLGSSPLRAFRVPRVHQELINRFFSMRWLQGAADGALRALGSILQTVRRVLEGQAGVLWALLLIALLLSVAAQFAPSE